MERAANRPDSRQQMCGFGANLTEVGRMVRVAAYLNRTGSREFHFEATANAAVRAIGFFRVLAARFHQARRRGFIAPIAVRWIKPAQRKAIATKHPTLFSNLDAITRRR